MSVSSSCNEAVIPAKLHYCWFGGGNFSPLIIRCMESWKKYAADFEILKWDESNCDLLEKRYVSHAAQERKWAFVSDYFRLKALFEHGGIYLDCDMELTASPKSFLENELFFEFEKNTVAAGMIGAAPHNPVIKELLDTYEDDLFRDTSRTIVTRITDLLIERHGLKYFRQECLLPGGIRIYPADVLLIDLGNGKNCAIHHYEGSWMNKTNDFLQEVRDYTQWDNLALHQKIYENLKLFFQVRLHFWFKILRTIKYRVISWLIS